MDLAMALAALGVGIVVGLTGMGGGALMTPVLVVVFNVPPLTAVSSDLLASAVMKPVGSAVHLRRGTVNIELVKWLCVGSVPAAFSGVLLVRGLARVSDIEQIVQVALGIALLATAAGLSVRAYLRLLERARRRDGRAPADSGARPPTISVRRVQTVLLGVAGGLVVGMTSVGSGSLVIIALMTLYPALKARQLVGTDLVQAVPLVASAALGHALFGSLDLSIALPLLVGGIPGAFLGAQLSARLSGGFVRRALAFVLLASALKMLGIPNTETVVVLTVALLVGPATWMVIRRRHGFPALGRSEVRAAATVRAPGAAWADRPPEAVEPLGASEPDAPDRTQRVTA